MTATVTETIRLGLIGDNIADSKTPRLHELAGGLLGRPTTYDRLVPKTLGLDFDAVFDKARAEGYRGLNITYPYKERVIARVTVDEPLVARLGACNTVVFAPDGPRGYNTDWSGFKAAYRHGFGDTPTGAVCMIGAGGVGKAVAFGLHRPRHDRPSPRRARPPQGRGAGRGPPRRGARPYRHRDRRRRRGAAGASGLVNCTPVGMVGYGGTPLPKEAMTGAAWAFDAVYTPVDTQFLQDAAAAGLQILSGYELYFYQGLHAISIFHGVDMDEATLRAALKE